MQMKPQAPQNQMI